MEYLFLSINLILSKVETVREQVNVNVILVIEVNTVGTSLEHFSV